MMSQNGQKHFGNLAANTASVFDHLRTLSITGVTRSILPKFFASYLWFNNTVKSLR